MFILRWNGSFRERIKIDGLIQIMFFRSDLIMKTASFQVVYDFNRNRVLTEL